MDINCLIYLRPELFYGCLGLVDLQVMLEGLNNDNTEYTYKLIH